MHTYTGLKTLELKHNPLRLFLHGKKYQATHPIFGKTFHKPPVNITADNILFYLSYNIQFLLEEEISIAFT